MLTIAINFKKMILKKKKAIRFTDLRTSSETVKIFTLF